MYLVFFTCYGWHVLLVIVYLNILVWMNSLSWFAHVLGKLYIQYGSLVNPD